MFKTLIRSAITAVFVLTALSTNAEEKILTIENQGNMSQFTLEQLLPHMDREIVTTTPWTNGETTFVCVFRFT